MVVCMCASNSTRDCTVACGGQVSSSGKSQEGFVDPDEAALSSTPQCPFPSLSWSGYIPAFFPHLAGVASVSPVTLMIGGEGNE